MEYFDKYDMRSEYQEYEECSYEVYFHENGVPEYGCSIELSLNPEVLSAPIILSDAACWEIPELKVRQENFAHAGFCGTIVELLTKVDKDIEMMKPGYPDHLQSKIDQFLSQIRKLSIGNTDRTHEIYHIMVRDPSGVSSVNVDESISHLINYSHFTRDFFENDSLGLILDNSVYYTPETQLNTPHQIANLVMSSSRVVCLSGAGISVESGIPPFRNLGSKNESNSTSSVAIWSEFDPNLMTVQGFNCNPAITEEWWKMKRSLLPKVISASPNHAHIFFSYLQSLNKLDTIITQNIDSLHSKSGVSEDKIIELHGHMRGLICSNNSSSRYNPIPFRDGMCEVAISEAECVANAYFSNEPYPRCQKCDSPLRTETVMFGQPIPSEDYKRAIDSISNCDLLFIIGSSLIVHPVNTLPQIAQKKGIPIILINRDETNYDSYAAGLINQPAGEFLKEVTRCLQELASVCT